MNVKVTINGSNFTEEQKAKISNGLTNALKNVKPWEIGLGKKPKTKK